MANSSDPNPQLVRIKLPFSVIQLWNDLEIGQVVKLPARNDIDDPMNILAHRDGEETICLEFTKALDEVISDAFSSEVVIVRVEQTFIDSSAQAQASPMANHKPCENTTGKKLAKKLNKKLAEARAKRKAVTRPEENGPDLDLECEDSSEGYDEDEEDDGNDDSKVKNGKSGAGTMKLPVVISPVSDTPKEQKEEKTTKAAKRRSSEEGSFSSGDEPTAKKSRGEKKHSCDLCGAVFIYFTSYVKHMKRHGGPTAAAALAAAEEKYNPPPPQKLPKILPKPPEHQHPMVTRRSASMSSPPAIKTEMKASPLAIGLPPTHMILPRPISPISPVFSTTTLIVPTVAPPQVNRSSIVSSVLPSSVNPSIVTPMVASHKPPPNVKVLGDGTHLMRAEDPLDCWVCLRQFKYPTSFMKHMRIEHELTVKVEEHTDRRKRSSVTRKSVSVHILNTPEILTSDSFNTGHSGEDQDDFRGHQSGQVVALQIKPNGDYVVVDSDMNEIVLGEYLLCSICLTSFNFKMEYIKHMSRSHGVVVKDMTEDMSGPSPPTKIDTQVFQCHVCNKKFFYRIPYEQHLKQIHNISMVVMDGSEAPNESYICRLCTMVFLYKTSFEKHMQREHGVDMASDSFAEGLGTSNSQRSSPTGDSMMFRCNLCLAWFKDSNDLDDHIISQHPSHAGGRYKMEKDDTEDLPPERVKDPGTKLSLIQCDHCSRTFKFRIAYSKHLRTAHQDKENDETTGDQENGKINEQQETKINNEGLLYSTGIRRIKKEQNLDEEDYEIELAQTENNNDDPTEDEGQDKENTNDKVRDGNESSAESVENTVVRKDTKSTESNDQENCEKEVEESTETRVSKNSEKDHVSGDDQQKDEQNSEKCESPIQPMNVNKDIPDNRENENNVVSGQQDDKQADALNNEVSKEITEKSCEKVKGDCDESQIEKEPSKVTGVATPNMENVAKQPEVKGGTSMKQIVMEGDEETVAKQHKEAKNQDH